MKVLTHVPLFALLNNPPPGVKLNFEPKHVDFLDSLFGGTRQAWDADYISYKSGRPSDVASWLSDFGFNSDFPECSDFAMASVMSIDCKYNEEPLPHFFNHSGAVYCRSLHKEAYETSLGGVYNIPLFGHVDDVFSGHEFNVFSKDFSLFVSEEKLSNTFPKDIKITHQMDLHVPHLVAESSVDFPELVGIDVDLDGAPATVDQVKSFTKFSLDGEGASIRQGASISMVVSSCLGLPRFTRQRRIHVIDGSFYVYIAYKGSLIFAVHVDSEDFIKGDGNVETFVNREPISVQNY